MQTHGHTHIQSFKKKKKNKSTEVFKRFQKRPERHGNISKRVSKGEDGGAGWKVCCEITGGLRLISHSFEQSSRERSPKAEAAQNCGGWRTSGQTGLDIWTDRKPRETNRKIGLSASQVGCINSGEPK